jgi:hypothetical protein
MEMIDGHEAKDRQGIRTTKVGGVPGFGLRVGGSKLVLDIRARDGLHRPSPTVHECETLRSLFNIYQKNYVIARSII